MPTGKIDKIKLNHMIMAGKSQREIAKHFGVTPGAVSQVKKELNINVVKSMALESAHRVVERNLDAVGQLAKINQKANLILDEMMRTMAENNLSEFQYKTVRELALKSMAEVRNQLSLQVEILRTLHDVQQVAAFQEEVLQIISEVDEKAKNEIIKRLKSRSVLRSSVVVT